jgi:hypothetical protein
LQDDYRDIPLVAPRGEVPTGALYYPPKPTKTHPRGCVAWAGAGDLLNRTVRLNAGETKNDDGRLVIMTNRVHQLLTQCVAGKNPGDFVFTREDGKPVKDFRGSWKKICDEAGAPERLFHDLRRTAVRNMVRAGIPERVAMQISGHRTRAIFDRYHIVSENDLREAATRMDRQRETAIRVYSDFGPETPPADSANALHRSVQ